MRVRCLWVVFFVLVLAGSGAVGARADGLPVLGIDVGGVGVSTPAGTDRFVTIPAGPNRTVVARVRRDGGHVVASNLLSGSFTIPAVAYDGSAGGLAADGKTLVLIEPRAGFPRAETTLAVIGPPLRLLRRIRLRGDFSFDAISSRGRLLYLIQYTVPTDPNRYLVRAYDLRAGRLLAAPVTDPGKRGEKMHGSPVTRASSPDGRWAYTLYDGGGGKPFVHMLDTSARSAHCVDLDVLAGLDLSRMRLSVDASGHRLVVRDGQKPAVLVDTRTFAVSMPQPPRGGGAAVAAVAWPLLALPSIGACAAAFGLLFALRRRRRPLALVP